VKLLIVPLLSTILASTAMAQVREDGGTCIITPRTVVNIASPVEGVIAEVFADRGDRVVKGQLLARLESEVEEVSLALAQKKAEDDSGIRSRRAELARLESKRKRTRKLAEGQLISGGTADEAEAEAESARQAVRQAELEKALAQMEAERAKADLERRKIESPLTGVITKRMLSAGEYVSKESPILTIAEIDPLYAEIVLPSERREVVRPGMEMEIVLPLPNPVVRKAVVIVVDPMIDAASGTFGMRLQLANPDGAIPAGLRCSFELPSTPAAADAIVAR
jgi:membrane fusion protein, multidrug efflux system